MHVINVFTSERHIGRACAPTQSVLFGFWSHLVSRIGVSLLNPIPIGSFERYADPLYQLAPNSRMLMNNPG
jgi:hypothetical protein